MSEDWSEKWYKQAFARSSAGKPKAEVWKHIESVLNGWFRRWYQSSAVGQSKQPKAEVWEALSAYVDQSILLRRQIRLRLLRSLSFALLFIVLPLSLADQFGLHTDNSTSLAIALDEALSRTSDFPPVQGGVVHDDHAGNARAAGQILQVLRADARATGPSLPLPENSQTGIVVQPEKSLTQVVRQQEDEAVNNLATLALTRPESPAAPLANAALDGNDLRPFTLPIWIVAGSGLYQHSNLYNETTRMGFARTSHISNESRPNFSIDLALMRRVNARSLLSFGVRINDVKGQIYQDFEGAEYLSKSLICTYQTFAMNYHRSLLRPWTNKRINLEVSGGIYGSYRSNITEFVGAQERHFLSPGIRKYDVGLQCAIQSIFQISKPVQLTLGTYYTNGLINIFKGVDKVPANFYTSFTASYGLSLGLRYQLK